MVPTLGIVQILLHRRHLLARLVGLLLLGVRLRLDLRRLRLLLGDALLRFLLLDRRRRRLLLRLVHLGLQRHRRLVRFLRKLVRVGLRFAGRFVRVFLLFLRVGDNLLLPLLFLLGRLPRRLGRCGLVLGRGGVVLGLGRRLRCRLLGLVCVLRRLGNLFFQICRPLVGVFFLLSRRVGFRLRSLGRRVR